MAARRDQVYKSPSRMLKGLLALAFLLILFKPEGAAAALPIRLVNGGNTYEGVLQVYRSGSWGTVCDDLWTARESATACRILFGEGYEGELRSASQYGTQTAPILMDNVQCSGTESNLFDCQHLTVHNCGHSEDVALKCHKAVRLVSGNTKYDGVLQVSPRSSSTWGTVCDDAWTVRESRTACRILFGSRFTGEILPASRYPTQTVSIVMDNVRCTGNEDSLYNCQHITNHNCGHSEDVALRCFSSVRLVGGNSQYDGVLQVYSNGTWGTVCDDAWTSRESETACSILFGSGFNAEFRRASQYPTQTAPIVMDDVRCAGRESNLLDCQHITSHNCRHAEDVALRCSRPGTTPTPPARLVDGTSKYDGVLQVYRSGNWGTVCDDSWFPLDTETACRILFGPEFVGERVRASQYRSQTVPILMDDVTCTGRESSLLDCSYTTNHNCGHNEDVALMCSATPARLVNGSTQYDGVLQVYSGGTWGTVCDDSWTSRESATACKIMFGSDFSVGELKGAGLYPTQSVPILMDDVTCAGNEQNLLECQHTKSHNCGHSEDVALRCTCGTRSLRAVSGVTGRMQSPGYPGNYVNNLDCVFLITASPGYVVSFRITQMSLELSHDYIEIRDGSLSTSRVLQRLTGGTATVIESTQRTMRILFHTDGSVVRDGFQATYTAVPVCGQRSFRATPGVQSSIQSPGFPGPHANNLDCVFLITATVGNVVSLRITYLDLEMNYDYIEIRDGSSSTSPLLRKLSSGTTPLVVNSTQTSMRILFHTDGSVVNSGFRAYFTAVAPAAPPSSSALRLVGGSTRFDGVLNVYISGTWGTVCDDLWAQTESRIACRTLFGSGFDGQLRQASQYPTQSSRILMDNVACTGTENRLLDCIYSSTHNCNHNEDVALMCYVTGADCDFEGPCPFEDISQGGFSWRRKRGNTPSTSTGPSGDHTTGSGYYMHVEASTGSSGDTAVLVTPPISRNATETCTLTFWYHMYGQDIGTLSIYTANPVQLSSKTRLWRLTGDQGQRWSQASMTLVRANVIKDSFVVLFEGVRGSGFRGDIAVDDVRISCT